ncbi:MAG TPA: hypothetical protein PLN48_03045 [Lachnospiraceae bacterium]|nr:hypothetical protein [Lachnospiraceae bacterium]
MEKRLPDAEDTAVRIDRRSSVYNIRSDFIVGRFMEEKDMSSEKSERRAGSFQENIITAEEISRILRDYSISQKNLSLMLDWGEITLTRYAERTSVPGAKNSARLQSLENPYIYQELLNQKIAETGGEVLKEKYFRKTQSRVSEKIRFVENEGNRTMAAANWFLSKSSGLQPLSYQTLDDLIYLAELWSPLLSGKCLFPEGEECLKKHFAVFGERPLPILRFETELSPEEKCILEFLKENCFDIFSALALEKLCEHEKAAAEIRGQAGDATDMQGYSEGANDLMEREGRTAEIKKSGTLQYSKRMFAYAGLLFEKSEGGYEKKAAWLKQHIWDSIHFLHV